MDFTNWTTTGSGQTGSGTPRSSSPSSPWYQDPYLWMNLAGTAADTWASTSSAHQANRTNIQLARENRDWQERMAGSEIQRRKRDIELAGGNPALAFVNGSGASSPAGNVPTVQPTFRPGGLAGLSTAALTAANIANVRADTSNKTASARIQNVEADIRENLNDPSIRGVGGTEADLRYAENWQRLGLQSLDQAIKRNQRDMTAAQLGQYNRVKDELYKQAVNQTKVGTIEREALENYAKAHGLEAERAVDLVGSIIEAIMRVAPKVPQRRYRK